MECWSNGKPNAQKPLRFHVLFQHSSTPLLQHSVNGYAMFNQNKYAPSRSCACLLTSGGFTLIELMVVIVILGFLVAMMPRVFASKDDQNRFDQTLKGLLEIKKALLGSSGVYANGQRQFSGYIADIGGLPPLEDVLGTPGDTSDDQPDGLWNQGTPPDWPDWEYKAGSRTWMGWRGPYIEAPPDDVLKDAWGNPFLFSVTDGNMTIKSLGADWLDGGSGYDEDITMVIRRMQYEAPVAGMVGAFNGTADLKIYFPSSGSESNLTIANLTSGDYFRFEQTAPSPADRDIPVGLRSIVLTSTASSKQVVFTVEPTGNWLGEIRLE